MVINIKDKNNFISNFLRPVGAVSDTAVIKSTQNRLHCITNNEQGVILFATYSINIDGGMQFNIPNIKRLEKVISFIEADNINLEFKSNMLSYKDDKIRFKYHFLDDNIIQCPKLSVEKIEELTGNVKFELDNDQLVELAKGAAFVSESEKLYFNISSEGVYGEITDKSNSSVDSYAIKLLSDVEIDHDLSFPVNFDIVRLLTVKNSPYINVYINTDKGFCIFEHFTDEYSLKYVVPGLQS
jgi:hypothetical protein